MPLIFRAFGDYKLPLYIYLTVPFVAIFGLNAFSIRLVSVLAGTFIPLFIYLILKALFNSKSKIPFLGALIFTLSPGTIFLSRIALEANLFLLLFCLSIYFLIQKKYSLSTLFYGLGLFTYNSSRVLLPFYLILTLFLIVKNKYKIFQNWYKFIPFIIFSLLTVIQTLNQSGQARFQWVSILDEGSVNHINELRAVYPRILVNKATFFIFTATKNYLSHFNPNFLFFNGGSHYQFSLPNFFIISPLFLLFLILGFYYLIKNIGETKYQILLFWLLISPLPSSITRDAPHVLRSIVFLPIIVIIIAIGINLIYQKLPKLTFSFVLFTLIYGQLLFWPKYKIYTTNYSSSWQYGYSQAVDYIKENYLNYDQIIFTKKYGEPHEFILFYWPWDPLKYQTDSTKDWNYHANWYWVDGFDKFKFVNDWEVKEVTKNNNSENKALLITSPNNYNQESRLIKTINFLDDTPAFDILEI
jgi:4-amino-4-deoxy-L-arabinose transferase-like glycosyltransferase